MGFPTNGGHRKSFLFQSLLFLPVLLSCTIHSVPGSSPMTQHSAGIRDPGANVTPLPEPLVISVLYFEDRIHLREFAWLRKGLADMLITDLSQAPGLEVVQREHLEVVLREQSLQAAGRVEEKTAVRIGRLTGATVILMGSATRVGDTLRLDAHFLDVERGTVLGAASVDGRLDDILLLEKELASRLLVFLRRDSAGGAAAKSPAITPSHSPDAPRRVPSPWPGSGKTDPFPIAPTRPGSAETEPFPLGDGVDGNKAGY
jgi:TolB-like protein